MAPGLGPYASHSNKWVTCLSSSLLSCLLGGSNLCPVSSAQMGRTKPCPQNYWESSVNGVGDKVSPVTLCRVRITLPCPGQDPDPESLLTPGPPGRSVLAKESVLSRALPCPSLVRGWEQLLDRGGDIWPLIDHSVPPTDVPHPGCPTLSLRPAHLSTRHVSDAAHRDPQLREHSAWLSQRTAPVRPLL